MDLFSYPLQHPLHRRKFRQRSGIRKRRQC